MAVLSTIKDLSKHVGESVQLRGWVYGKRSSGKIRFLMLRDGSGIVQLVFIKGNVPDGTFEEFDKLTQESSVIVTGKVREEKNGQAAEMSNIRCFIPMLIQSPRCLPTASVRPEAAFYSEQLREFILPYDAVRAAELPEVMLLEFSAKHIRSRL